MRRYTRLTTLNIQDGNTIISHIFPIHIIYMVKHWYNHDIKHYKMCNPHVSDIYLYTRNLNIKNTSTPFIYRLPRDVLWIKMMVALFWQIVFATTPSLPILLKNNNKLQSTLQIRIYKYTYICGISERIQPLPNSPIDEYIMYKYVYTTVSWLLN